MCNSACSIRAGFHCRWLRSVWLCEPSLVREGCYPFCHVHTSAAHREEVSMQGTWLIEGTEARCAQLRLPANTEDASPETLLSVSTPCLRRVANSTECVRCFLHSSHIVMAYLDFIFTSADPKISHLSDASNSKKAIKHFVAFMVW